MEKQTNGLVVGIVAISILLFAGLAYLIWRLPSDALAPVETSLSFNDEGSPVVGPENAPVTVQIFGDFQCPACRFAEPGLAAAMQEFKDRVRFVWKDFPLESIHPKARLGANAARCAQNQGKFWEYHDILFAKQDEWVNASDSTVNLKAYAQGLGLDTGAFNTCLDTRASDAAVKRDISEGLANRVDRTPTEFINNQRVFSMSQAQWRDALNAALQAAPNAQPAGDATSSTATP